MTECVTAWQSELPDGPVDENAGSNAYPWPQAKPLSHFSVIILHSPLEMACVSLLTAP